MISLTVCDLRIVGRLLWWLAAAPPGGGACSAMVYVSVSCVGFGLRTLDFGFEGEKGERTRGRGALPFKSLIRQFHRWESLERVPQQSVLTWDKESLNLNVVSSGL